MKKILVLIICVLTIGLTSEAKKYRLFYLGGQSNMDGYGYVNDLPDSLRKAVDGVMIYHVQMTADGAEANGEGVWSELIAGHGTDFKSDGQSNEYGKRFGLELTFGKRIQELFPGEHIALVKYSKGGTSIDISSARHFGCWDPDYAEKNGVNQWDHYLATIHGAYSESDIDGDGELDELVPSGILWMQGESDAGDAIVASKYEDNLKRLIDLMRASLLTDDLPVIVGRISDSKNDKDNLVWDFGNVVRAAQHRFVEHDSAAGIVTSTDNYNYSDPWHYDSEGYIDLGIQFAEEMAKLLSE